MLAWCRYGRFDDCQYRVRARNPTVVAGIGIVSVSYSLQGWVGIPYTISGISYSPLFLLLLHSSLDLQTRRNQPKQPCSSRNDHIRVITLRELQWTYRAIANHLQCTVRQVQTACTEEHPTPSKPSGPPTTMIPTQVEELVRYVCSSRNTRLCLIGNHWMQDRSCGNVLQ